MKGKCCFNSLTSYTLPHTTLQWKVAIIPAKTFSRVMPEFSLREDYYSLLEVTKEPQHCDLFCLIHM